MLYGDRVARYHDTLTSTLDLPVSVKRLWPLISDTDRTNRLLGLPVFAQTRPDTGLNRIVSGQYFGAPVSWRELPFEWVFEQYFRVRREFLPPMPIRWLETATTLAPLGDNATRVTVSVVLGNDNPLIRTGARLVVGQQMLRDLRRVYQDFGRLLANETAVNARMMAPRPPTIQEARLALAVAHLVAAGTPAALAERLADHLRRAEDAAVLKMRSFALAELWGAPPMDVLRLCLHATCSGLLDLEWDVLCPSCRGPSVRAQRLDQLDSQAHCPACDIRYDLNFDESVEVRFSVSPTIRLADDLSYCIGGPANTRHILAQVPLMPGETRTLPLRLAAGRYRVRGRQVTDRITFTVSDDAPETTLALRPGDGQDADDRTVRAGDVQLALTSAFAEPTILVVEDSSWSKYAASAALVTSISEFRALFSSEVLAPGIGLAVRNLTFLFSDLKDSTAIYDEIGDSPAYARVRDHFAVMSAAIARHDGTLVKTIGDAVMAVFARSEQAIAAAIAIQRDFVAGEIARGRPALRIKLGLHRGPCIAVNANDLLDYFGSTVNTAARIQGESQGGDIVISDALHDDPLVREIIGDARLITETYPRRLKGISRELTLTRLHLPEVEMENAK